MSVLLPTTINGVSFQAHAEYTHDTVAQAYLQNIEVFRTLFNLPSATAEATINSSNFQAAMQISLQNLITLAKDGLGVPTNPGNFYTPDRTWKMSLQMVSAVDQIIRSLEAAGINIDVSNPGAISISLQDVKNWRNLTYNSNIIKDILNYAEAVGGDQNRTLQALTELVYVKTGNEIISDTLENLEGALSSTKDALNILNEVQQLHNQIAAVDKEGFGDYINEQLGMVSRYTATQRNTIVTSIFLSAGVTIGVVGSPRVTNVITVTLMSRLSARLRGGPYWTVSTNSVAKVTTAIGDPSLFGFQIPKLADAHFGPLSPQLTSALASNISPAILTFLELGEKLRLQISELAKITPPLPGGGEDPQTLLGRIRVVYNDMTRVMSASPSDLGLAVKRWILDSYSTASAANQVGEPGDLQQNITNAITAAQNLNDQQKEEVRRFLFVFEEYYKSASAILNKLTQIIEKMAQGIAR